MFLVVVSSIILVLDLYVFQAIKILATGSPLRRMLLWTFIGFTVFTISVLLLSFFLNYSLWAKGLRTYVFAIIFLTYFVKLLFLPFLALDDLIRAVKWIGMKLNFNAVPFQDENGVGITRSAFLLIAGLMIATVPGLALVYGMIYGGTHYKVRKVRLVSPTLPKEFDGFKIVQFSDAHVGTFITTAPMEEAMGIIAAQEADLILFTGDLVNTVATEAEKFIPIFGKLTAPHGVYSILGNHDYADYGNFTPEEKAANFKAMKATHKAMNWKLMLDENVEITRKGTSIALAGCQNWGAKARFKKYGNIEKTLSGIPEDRFTILMTHDPSHWEGQVLGHKHHVDLTLSGHTHGMQFGIRTNWLKWSPVQYVYDQWIGLYKKAGKQLYVNAGLGYIGYPGRAGIRPEITVFELNRAKDPSLS